MDYRELTAPCGLDCFNCDMFLAEGEADIRNKKVFFKVMIPVFKVISLFSEKSAGRLKVLKRMLKIPQDRPLCRGCRMEKGKIPLMDSASTCKIYECAQKKGLHNCSECADFPCSYIYPKKAMADVLPHNIKVTNCCLIKKHGLEKWAEEYAKKVKRDYFTGELPFKL